MLQCTISNEVPANSVFSQIQRHSWTKLSKAFHEKSRTEDPNSNSRHKVLKVLHIVPRPQTDRSHRAAGSPLAVGSTCFLLVERIPAHSHLLADSPVHSLVADNPAGSILQAAHIVPAVVHRVCYMQLLDSSFDRHMATVSRVRHCKPVGDRLEAGRLALCICCCQTWRKGKRVKAFCCF